MDKTNPNLFYVEGEAPGAPGLKGSRCLECGRLALLTVPVCPVCLSRRVEPVCIGASAQLRRFSTVGSLMRNLIGGRMAIEGRLARLVYTSLYRMHLIAIHGWLKGTALLLVGRVNRIVRPRLKLH
jgi:hypothetical protein